MKPARDPYLTTFYVQVKAWGGLVSLALNLPLLWLGWWLASQFHMLLPAPGVGAAIVTGGSFFMVLAVLNYPIDYLFGHLLERYEGRSRQSLGSWHLDWLGGSLALVLLQTSGLALLALWLQEERFQFYWIPPP